MIYSLRTFKQTEIQEDETIGRKFETIYKKTNPEEFKWHFENTLDGDFKNCPDDIYAFIYSINVCVPLRKVHKHYIVTEHGNTYANVSFKK